MKLQKAVLREITHILLGSMLCAAAQLGIFALLGRLDASVWWGTLTGAAFSVANFVLLGFTVQRAAGNSQKAKLIAQFSYSVRMLLTCAVAVIGFKVAALDGVATAISLFFPRITILAMQLLGYYKPQPKEEKTA